MADIFKKIIEKEIPASIVYEDDVVIAFLDINPINKGHVLVTPKEWSENVFDASDDQLAHMMRTAAAIARALKQSGICEGVNLLMNNGAAAGQEIPRTHMHIIPRHMDDAAFSNTLHTPYEDGETDTYTERIKGALET